MVQVTNHHIGQPGMSSDVRSALIEIGIQAAHTIITNYVEHLRDEASRSKTNIGQGSNKARSKYRREHWPRRRKLLHFKRNFYRSRGKSAKRWSTRY